MNTPKILPQIFQSENHKKYGIVDSNVNKFEKNSPNRVYSVNKQPKPVNLIRQAKSQAQQYYEKSLSSRPSSCADDQLSDEQVEHEVENIEFDKVELIPEESNEQPYVEIQSESHNKQSQSIEDQKQKKEIDSAQKSNPTQTEQNMKPSTQIEYNQNPQPYIGQPVQNTEQNFNLIPLKPQFKLFKKQQSQNDLKIKREESKGTDVLSAFLSENLQPVKNEPQKTVKRSKKRQNIQDAVIIQQEMNQKDLISNIINDQIGDQIEDDLEVDLDANFEEMISKPIMVQIVQPIIDLAEKEQDKNHNNTVSEVKIDLNKDNQDNITQNTLNNKQSEEQVEFQQNNENIQLKNYSNLNGNNIQQIQQITETIQNYNIQQQQKEANPIHEQTKEATTINNDSVETKIIQKQYEIESQTKIPKETNKTENVKQLSLAENMKPQNINQNENQPQLQSNYQNIKENISLSKEQNTNEHKPKQQHQVEQQHKMKPQIEPQQPSSIKPQQSNAENELNLIRKAEAERQQRELKRILKEKELKSMKLLLATEETLRREISRQEMLQQEKEQEQVKLARIQQEKIQQEIMIQDAIKQQKVQEVQKQEQNEMKPENKHILKATSTPMLNKEKMKERADQINFQNIQRQKINKIQEDLKFLRKVLENQVKSGSDKLKGLKQSVKVNEEYLKQLENCTTIKELDKICAKYQDKLEDLIIEIKR
ncbi:Conserved_hypothetical protein [Hexamita inflata]|uniref:Uncharacterized protein n=1 Tax=Hexamita inflata TaxID=28002 RepID=A0AA86U1V7_9EUKA|nr:Conserved hypothetical protein [Hexamita inflata]